MSLREPRRSAGTFEVDESVRRLLAAWSRQRDTELGLLELRRGAERLSPEQKRKLVERLAEISLGLFAVLEKAGSPPDPGPVDE
jgi:hypothetical protein